MPPTTSDPKPSSLGESIIAFFVFVIGAALLLAGIVWVAHANGRRVQDAFHRAERDARNTAAQIFDRLEAIPPGASEDSYRDALDPRAKLITFDTDGRRTELTIAVREAYDTYMGEVAHLRLCFDYRLFEDGAGESTHHEVDCPENAGRTLLDFFK